MPVYFIQAGQGGPVKIGHSFSPESRMAALQGAHSVDLVLIRVIECSASVKRFVETWLHRHFSLLRLRGEWFRYDPSMLSIAVPITELPSRHTSALPPARVCGLEFLGFTTGQLATGLGITPQAVSGRHARGRVPVRRVLALEKLTGVSRHALRPDIYPVEQISEGGEV